MSRTFRFFEGSHRGSTEPAQSRHVETLFCRDADRRSTHLTIRPAVCSIHRHAMAKALRHSPSSSASIGPDDAQHSGPLGLRQVAPDESGRYHESLQR